MVVISKADQINSPHLGKFAESGQQGMMIVEIQTAKCFVSAI
jgi:hypothetical protein